MDHPDLVGLQRQPMPADVRSELAHQCEVAQERLHELFQLVAQFDGGPMPTDRSGFYAVSGQIRAVERELATYVKHCAFWLTWNLDISNKPELTPRFPGMVPKH